jgi:hypothetical protein
MGTHDLFEVFHGIRLHHEPHLGTLRQRGNLANTVLALPNLLFGRLGLVLLLSTWWYRTIWQGVIACLTTRPISN